MADLLEVTHRIDLELGEWLEEICRIVRPLVPWANGVYGATVRGFADRPGLEIGHAAGDVHLMGPARDTSHQATVQDVAAATSLNGRVYTVGDAYCGSENTVVGVTERVGTGDAMIVSGLDSDGTTLDFVAFAVLSSTMLELSARDAERWSAAAAHLAAAWRLRRRLLVGDGAAPSEAVLSPAGQCQHAEGQARSPTMRDALSLAVRAVERARTRDLRTDDDAVLEAWRALYEGRWTLVEQTESDGRRLILARVNEARRLPRPELTAREQEVGCLLGLGISQKSIGYELGLAATTVALHVRSIKAKLGASSTVEVVRLLSGARGP